MAKQCLALAVSTQCQLSRTPVRQRQAPPSRQRPRSEFVWPGRHGGSFARRRVRARSHLCRGRPRGCHCGEWPVSERGHSPRGWRGRPSERRLTPRAQRRHQRVCAHQLVRCDHIPLAHHHRSLPLRCGLRGHKVVFCSQVARRRGRGRPRAAAGRQGAPCRSRGSARCG